MRKKTLNELASKYLWDNLGESMGPYGGGKKVFKKMPWYKFCIRKM